ncbi:glutamyl aminopeptidase-like isoform X2 [Amphibalanus amphitrite]|uniref:glutamyl aminopeptidase-like isoform X1 n=1 Tax=Amphibalanus amphitrite TaxID=1232801 RepID=UPI001C9110A9|nr:glutamyl aminopeptidase-like isoform X1 [Amphibalanus amphitrite]XP_043192459.1 glutamyl aminopeptidase-like isoform X2 [Amphibalanus amphitrite]
METGLFTGTVDILIRVSKKRSHLVTHSKFLNITRTSLTRPGGDTVKVKRAFEYEPNEFWVVQTGQPISPGNYTLSLEFSGNLTRSITGLYRSVYTNGDTGQKRFIATSKFQPTFARRAFPCFDEPSFKSTFSTTLVRPSGDGYIALSNMPVEREEADMPSQGLTKVHFKKSVPMVTYLACFIVCDFTYQERVTNHDVVFRVYAAPDRVASTQYSADVGANITDFFEDYFGVKYPLPKQDMIAIPDFVSGAMEHWGLITYRETNLLYSPRSSSSYNQQRIAAVVSHELAHQWFGNLVTLNWWNDLWLNEGFASYIEYKGLAHVHPDWDAEAHLLPDDLQRVMDLDATLSSHPIVQPVDTPDQITSIFDAISYAKGASVLRMLEGFMGDEEFRQGISNFLKRFAYDNAVTLDLWNELSKVSSKRLPISKIMDTWTRQMGFPVLEMTRGAGGATYTVTQRRFLADKEAEDTTKSPYNYRWEVPVTYVTSEDPKPKQVWFHTDQDSIEIPAIPGGWTKVNSEQRGYYRVNYDRDGWAALTFALLTDHEVLPATDRSSLINDAFALAGAGHVSYSVPLRLASYLSSERHYIPWKTAVDELTGLQYRLRYTELYGDFRKYILELVGPHFDSLGWEDVGSHLEKRNRVQLLKAACRAGHPGCLQGAADALQQWLDDPQHYISPNLRSLVYKYGMEQINSADAWDITWSRYINENNSQQKNKLVNGLAAVRQPWLLSRLLNLAKNESYVRSQDFFTLCSTVAANPVGNPIVWNFLRAEWESYLVPRFSLNERYLGFMVPRITRHFDTQLQLDEMRQFFARYPEAGAGERSRREALETTQANINWLKNHRDELARWLAERS